MLLSGKKNQKIKILYNISNNKKKIKLGYIFPYEKINYNNKIIKQQYLKIGINKSKSILLSYIKDII
ncbi:hypothetical protein (apicoplast) [Babesia microti strain RI]|uniref:Uncharacterized protein n=1 Tax=Babesia microti (strain RI) TaxID=1133968 RepID=A0A068W5Y7_BABMR|nr:hypothetical protein [Babesia microti strain RI]CDR32609.1 hypothetical protein [Babesia microti strain RI]|eukprot:YP_009363178.1 hypothetical protein (apicoplast) [Babesia microti strain RI]